MLCHADGLAWWAKGKLAEAQRRVA
jgi:hypothetical protein